MIRLGGPAQFFCQIRKFLARVLALAGKQKRGALLYSGQRRTHKKLKQKCTSPTPPPPLPKLDTNHPMVETPPPPTQYQQRNARISALLTPLVVHWWEQFLIGVVLLLLWLLQAKKIAKKAWRWWQSTNIVQTHPWQGPWSAIMDWGCVSPSQDLLQWRGGKQQPRHQRRRPWLRKLPTCSQHVAALAKCRHILPKCPCRDDTKLIPTQFFVSVFADIHQIFL